MPLIVGSSNSQSKSKTSTRRRQPANSEYVIGEINAFIAIRDELLAEVEEAKTEYKLHSLIVANNFVETCLTPARSPYDMQVLPESDARRERERCEEIKRRVQDLKNQLDE